MKRTPKRPGVKQYDHAPTVDIKRSTFDRSHPWKGTFDSGLLIPFLVEEILPGDSYRVRANIFCRLATPLHPTLDNLHITSHFFFVPNRLVWKNWQKFMGEQDNPGDSTDYVIPTYTASGSGFGLGTTYDYMGLPVLVNDIQTKISALPARCYNLIWNTWYRDENLQQSLTVDVGDGPDSFAEYRDVQHRGKRKTYLTSALPWPQKGPGVDLPLGTVAPIQYTGVQGQRIKVQDDTDGGDGWEWGGTSAGTNSFGDQTAGPSGNLEADLSSATAATINDLRQAFQIQKLQERDARGGTRYRELVKSHFRVDTGDARVDRPEYLGGSVTPVGMNTIPQTSSSDATTPQGNLAAFGTAMASNHGFTKSFVEHGYVIGLISVRADLNFQQNIERKWSRQTKYDFYWPALQALGEQSILSQEIYADGTAADLDVWGYQERWSEYRTCDGKITGEFRSKAAALGGSLDPWHYALDYDTRPLLNAEFIQDTPPVERTVAVQDEPEFLCDAWIDIKAARPMPVYSVPGYIDHF